MADQGKEKRQRCETRTCAGEGTHAEKRPAKIRAQGVFPGVGGESGKEKNSLLGEKRNREKKREGKLRSGRRNNED